MFNINEVHVTIADNGYVMQLLDHSEVPVKTSLHVAKDIAELRELAEKYLFTEVDRVIEGVSYKELLEKSAKAAGKTDAEIEEEWQRRQLESAALARELAAVEGDDWESHKKRNAIREKIRELGVERNA